MKDRKKRKSRKKLRRLCWLLAALAAAVFVLSLLLYKPVHYNPPQVLDEKEVPKYLTHVLGPAFNNGVQLGEPFDLIVTQTGINEVLAWYYKHKWSKQFGDINYSAPEVVFAPDTITLMGAVAAARMQVFVTVVDSPAIDEKGLLNLRVVKVKVGAVNVTPIARIIARCAYRKRVETKPINKDDWRAKIAASLLSNVPFDPVFPVEDRKVLTPRPRCC